MANSPFGAYANENQKISVTFPKITDLKKITYTLELDNGGPRVFTDGAFEGRELIPKPRPAGDFTDRLDIQWCPDQNKFQVTVAGVTYTLLSQGTAVGPCCAWCDNKKYANTAWKRVSDNGDPAKCEWKRFCSGCSECDP